ncbi:Tetratricopeptide repeat-containing protein [bacterium A37T11]|nr:Tetratricopeptide repeat-containing protein [bacterium A37T11]
MLKNLPLAILLLSFFSTNLSAQQNAWQDLDQAYNTGMELYERGKYTAASEQFNKVETSRIKSVLQEDEQGKVSLLKENARFYQAVCALELGNWNSEEQFLKYIRDYPVSANSKAAFYQVGRSYFAKKNYPKAIEWFRKIGSGSLSGSENTEYRFKLAYSLFMTKDYREAKPLFAKLKDENNRYTESAIYYYAYLCYTDGEYKAALTEFEKLKGSKTFETSYPYYITALYFLDKRYDDVLAYALPILETTKQEHETDLFRIIGATYFAKNDLIKANEYYEKFQAGDQGKTQNNQDSYQIGYTAYKLKNYEKGIHELEKLDTADAYYQSGMVALGDAFLKTGNKQSARNAFFSASKLDYDPALKEEGLFNYAKLSYELEFHQVALTAIQEYIKTYPRSTRMEEAKTLLAEVLLSTKNYRAAVDILESLKKRSPEANAAYQKMTFYRGLEFYNERAFENAISMLMRSESYPIDPEILALATYWKAEAMYEVRKYKEAVTNFDKFLHYPAARKTDVYYYANYALAYAAFRNENFSTSANYFERFLSSKQKIDENTRNDATARLADSYFSMKRYNEAMALYDKLINSNSKSQDYALFQRGIIQGLEGNNTAKLNTLNALLQKYPESNYADDAHFEIPYTYFLQGSQDTIGHKALLDTAINGLQKMVTDYPRSSYVPRALMTIGLVQFNKGNNEAAEQTFRKVVDQYSTTPEAKQALQAIQNIYLDKNDAAGFIQYANTTSIGNLSTAEQDNLTFQTAYNLYAAGKYTEAVEAINAYFDKFPKPIQEKYARFIRAESLVNTNHPDDALRDYGIILNDWTSTYTERALVSVANLYLKQKKYNEAIVHLKKLELTSEYRTHYGFAVTNLMICYFHLGDWDLTLQYARLLKDYEKASDEDKALSSLYAAKAYLSKGDTANGEKELRLASLLSKTETAAEATYKLGQLQFEAKAFKTAQKTAFEVINNMSSYDYWVAKSFILLADTYTKLKDDFQAKSTLQSVIDNYKGDDDVIPSAKERLELLNNKNKK